MQSFKMAPFRLCDGQSSQSSRSGRILDLEEDRPQLFRRGKGKGATSGHG
jgi:hypothetical protein